ncbi:MAG: M20/M25/M40 family metallo-hydrolase [Nitrospirota bacterium]
MNRLIIIFVLFFMSISSPAFLVADEGSTIHHDLRIVLAPEKHRIDVQDTITLPESHPQEFQFVLHGDLQPLSPSQGVNIVRQRTTMRDISLESFRVKLPADSKTFVLKYGGVIHHPVAPSGKEQARGIRETPGIISTEGVYLSGSSFWYPKFDGELITFNIEIELPGGWDAVSQGERTSHDRKGDKTLVRWESPEPQNEIFIVAAPFTEYSKPAGGVLAMAFLRAPDKDLAEKYLNATVQYISMYEKLIGPYPYKKFALVENFWETGFGMPSFTLLGPKILRFPFIIDSSYPHEVLHNWWGNAVFPEYRKGNWSEGLTAYLADHLMKEQKGSGAEYRQTTLQKYADYVLAGRDFPLFKFRSRHSSSSEAVGYGKSLMFIHMLRQELGDEVFVRGLRNFYSENKFRVASFDDLRKSLEKVSGKELKNMFAQWINRRGAPKIKLSNVTANVEGSEYLLSASIEQIQSGKTYKLRIPIAVTMEGQEQAYQTGVAMDKKRLELKVRLPSRPLRLDVDPEFDLFRRLDREEIPPALSQALGAEKMLILLPSKAEEKLLHAYRDVAEVLSNAVPAAVEVKFDKDYEKLPSDCAVIILGWENRFFSEASLALQKYKLSIDRSDIKIGKAEIPREKHSVVFAAWNPKNKDVAITLIASSLAEALPALSRKLPHYHKYSYLIFKGDESENIAKGRWPVFDSPMTAFVPDKDGKVSKVEMGRLAPREPLARLPQVFSAEKMMETITFLSSNELKGRGLGTEELNRAAEFIAEKFREAGLKPGGDTEGSYFQIWKDPELNVTMKNVIGIVPGKKSAMSGQSVIVGAHYDHLGMGWPDVRQGNEGKIHPGADDNASGVSVLVELAKVLGNSFSPDRSIIFVAFTGEEADKRGSKYFVQSQKPYPAEKCVGMINLDTVGRLWKKKILVLGAGSAREWAHIFRGARFVTGVELETVIERLDSSDNVSFEETGVPAVQLFSGPHLDYHRPTDTADKIDIEGLLKVALIAKEVVEYLAGREEPLTVTIKREEGVEPVTKMKRKVSLGIIPDFAYAGTGIRLSGVMPKTAAELCGLQEGDIIIEINSAAVARLKDLSMLLRSSEPGDRLSIKFLRNGLEKVVEAELNAR